MFASLKNKIKEETGNDITNLPILANQALKGRYKGRHSRQGSGSSIGSISLESVNDELPSSPLSLSRQDVTDVKLEEGKVLSGKEVKRIERREDEWRRIMQKKEEEWTKRLEKKEEEFKKRLEEHQKEWKRSVELLEKEKNVLEEEKREVVKQKLGLEDALKVAEEYKKKVYQYQEDIDQLEGFQTQEMAKIKHLLLVKEQELADKGETLKESNNQIETLRTDVNRLHRCEEELSNVQEAFNTEKADLLTHLEEAEKRAKESTENAQQLSSSLQSEQERLAKLDGELQRVRSELQGEQSRCTELQQSLGRERQDKDAMMLRNAQVSQEVQLAQQAAREQQRDHTELLGRLTNLEETLITKDKEIERWKESSETLTKRVQELEGVEHNKQAAAQIEKELRNSVSNLEEQVAEKNKSVKVLQQRLVDMKKTLQRELRGGGGEVWTGMGLGDVADSFLNANSGSTSMATINPNRSTRTATSSTSNHLPKGEELDDINFKYLKHVLIKFLTSREYEAQHLTRAVATLLRFTPEEERLLRETLDWKMSWFGTRPSLGFGQTSKTIPPS